MAVGLGCFFILGVRALQANLLEEFNRQVGENSPDFVLIDVQPDQVEGCRRSSRRTCARPARIMPLMRGRVDRVDGSRMKLPIVDAIRERGRGSAASSA